MPDIQVPDVTVDPEHGKRRNVYYRRILVGQVVHETCSSDIGWRPAQSPGAKLTDIDTAVSNVVSRSGVV